MSDTEQDEGESRYEIEYLDPIDQSTNQSIDPATNQPINQSINQSIDNYLRHDGRARVKFANGDKFEGTYNEGKREGFGTYIYKSGAEFAGEYLSGRKSGAGKLRYPDRTEYTGDFLNGLRHGKGVYVFANGDKYDGEWKKGIKHGKGTYYFAQSINQPADQSTNQSINRVEGEWSNGRLMHGTWYQNGDDRLIGRFVNNQPNGHSIYQSINKGFLYAGNHVFDEEKQITFQPIDQPINQSTSQTHQSTNQPIDQLTLAKRVLSVAKLNADWIEGNYRLKKIIDGVPNLRRINQSTNQSTDPSSDPSSDPSTNQSTENESTEDDQSINATNVFVCGQPSISGLKSLIDWLIGLGFDRHHFIECRSEPFLYINDQSYTPRHPKQLHQSINLSINQPINLSVEQLEALESSYVQSINQSIDHTGGCLKYQKEVYAEFEENRRSIEVEVDLSINQSTDQSTDQTNESNEQNDQSINIQSMRQLINRLIDEDGMNLSLIRNPMSERPITQSIDQSINQWNHTIETIVSLHQSIDQSTNQSIIFIDWLGRENATSAAVLSLAAKQLIDGFPSDQPLNQSTDQSTDQEQEDVDPSTNQSTDQSIDQEENDDKDDDEEEEEEEESEEPINQSTDQPISEPVPESIPEPINQSIDQSIDEPPRQPELEPFEIDEKRGVFTVTHWLISCLIDGSKSKNVVDRLIDECADAVNLRECVYQAHQQWREANNQSTNQSINQSILWLNAARVAIERYCMIIASVAYLAAVRPINQSINQSDDQQDDEENNQSINQSKTPILSFSQWIRKQVDVDMLKEKCQLFAWD